MPALGLTCINVAASTLVKFNPPNRQKRVKIMSKASKTSTHTTKRKPHGHAKLPVTTKHVAGTGRKPRKVAKRPHTPATSPDDLPGFVLIAEEHYFESPDSDLDHDADNDELDE